MPKFWPAKNLATNQTGPHCPEKTGFISLVYSPSSVLPPRARAASPVTPVPSLTLQRRRRRGHEGEEAAQGSQALRAGAGEPRRQVPVSLLVFLA